MEIFTFVCVRHVLMFNFSPVDVEHCRHMNLSSFGLSAAMCGCKANLPAREK